MPYSDIAHRRHIDDRMTPVRLDHNVTATVRTHVPTFVAATPEQRRPAVRPHLAPSLDEQGPRNSERHVARGFVLHGRTKMNSPFPIAASRWPARAASLSA